MSRDVNQEEVATRACAQQKRQKGGGVAGVEKRGHIA